MEKRKGCRDDEHDKASKTRKCERSTGATECKSPPNRNSTPPNNHGPRQMSYESGYLGEKNQTVTLSISHKGRGETGKGNGNLTTKKKGRKGANQSPPSHNREDSVAKMQTQLEVANQKCQREITMDVAGNWRAQMFNVSIRGKTGKSDPPPNKRTEDERMEESFLLRIRSWISGGNITHAFKSRQKTRAT